jgi:hypothetical protein
MIQELDSSRRIRQCNWVRFLVSTDSCHTEATEDDARRNEGLEPNMTAMLREGQPVFELTKSVWPHTPIVVHFQDIARDGLLAYSYNGIPLGQKYASPTELQGNYCKYYVKKPQFWRLAARFSTRRPGVNLRLLRSHANCHSTNAPCPRTIRCWYNSPI